MLQACTLLFLILIHNASSHEQKLKDRHTRQLESYEIVYPQKITKDGSFLSNHLPHFFNLKAVRLKRDLLYNEPDVHYELPVKGVSQHIELYPHEEFIGPGLVVERHGPQAIKNGRINNIKISKIGNDQCHYTGKVRGVDGSRVALSTCNGLAGIIHTASGEYLIEPVEKNVSPQSRHPHILYKRSASTNGSIEAHVYRTNCGTTGSWSQAWNDRVKWEYHSKRHRQQRNVGSDDVEIGEEEFSENNSTKKLKSMEVLVVADYTTMLFHKNEDIEIYILTIMNIVASNVHDASFGINLNVVLVRILLVVDDIKELDKSGTKSAEEYLGNFCKFATRINPTADSHPNHHDLAILITRHELCLSPGAPNTMLGLSYLGGICRPDQSCNVNEDDGLILGYTITHEIGHNLGAEHDEGQDNGCPAIETDGTRNIMSPIITMGMSKWSKCSRFAMTSFIKGDTGDCMNDLPSDHKFQFPDVPPGAIYDGVAQCSTAFHVHSYPCLVGDFCDRLFCRLNNKFCVSRGDPPADGTFCATGMWCFRKQCVPVGIRPGATNGGWGSWGDWSECSRSCGGGVAASVRECDNPRPANGGRYCLGEHRRFKICNTALCPTEGKSFRDIQCKDTNERPYNGRLHEWRNYPGYFMYADCALICINEHDNVVLRSPLVIDGTPCKPGSRDRCVAGKCRPIGCDWIISSTAREDQCGVCRGNGVGCEIVNGVYNEKRGKDYTYFATIPKGAANVYIREITPSKCVLAVRSEKNTSYYLNGNRRFLPSQEVQFGENYGVYENRDYKERIFIRGPLTQDLHLYIVFNNAINGGIKYQYSIHLPMPNYRPIYHWEYVDWELCSTACGGGIQRSKPKCSEEIGGVVDDSYCDPTDKPEDKVKPCNEHPCTARWWNGPWSSCNGKNATKVQQRIVLCVRDRDNDETESEVVPIFECPKDKPITQRCCADESSEICNEKRSLLPTTTDVTLVTKKRRIYYQPSTKAFPKHKKKLKKTEPKDDTPITKRRQHEKTTEAERVLENDLVPEDIEVEDKTESDYENQSENEEDSRKKRANIEKSIHSEKNNSTEKNRTTATNCPTTKHIPKTEARTITVAPLTEPPPKVVVDPLHPNGMQLSIIPIKCKKFPYLQNDREYQVLGRPKPVADCRNTTKISGEAALGFLSEIVSNATSPPIVMQDDSKK